MNKNYFTVNTLKPLSLLLFVCLALQGLAQAPPQQINYQGVARSSNGTAIANKPLGIKFEILQGSVSVYTETQTVNSNGLGLFNTQIGQAPANLSSINWAQGSYSLRVGIDTLGGSAYVNTGTSPIASVPYALYAGSAPSPTVSYANDVLTVGNQSVTITTSTASAAAPTLVINGSNLSTVGGNTVLLPSNSTSLTGSGAITVSTLVPGSSYNINTPSVTLYSGIPLGPASVTASILQINGTFPNYSLAVAPQIAYSQTTGSLTLSNLPGTTPSYNFPFYITPTLVLTANILSSGPSSNQVDFSPITPWRQGAGNTVTLAVVATQSVGINLSNPTAELHVNGYTKLGNTAPAVQMRKITNTVSGTAGAITSISFSSFTTGPKLLSVSVMVEGSTNGTGNWVPPAYTLSAGYEYNWKLNGTNIELTTTAGNSANILGKNIQVLITYEP